jgi:hypothetical protein
MVDSQKTHSEFSEFPGELSVRAQVFKLLEKFPSLKATAICEKLGLDFKQKKKYIDNLRYQWKAHYRNGRGLKRPTFHNWRGSVYAPDGG